MNLKYSLVCFLSACLSLAGTRAEAELPVTELRAISPSGGQAGSSLNLTLVAGENLEEIGQLQFSHPSITAVPRRNGEGPEADIVPNQFVVQISPDVPEGIYEVSAGGVFGLSNPRRFAVGPRTEVSEAPDNNRAESATPVPLGCTINGSMDGGSDVDWYRFEATQGQRVILDCWGERLDSRLNGVISVYASTTGRRLAHSGNVKGEDPVLVFDVPQNGGYLVKLHDLTFRSGAEYGYRLQLHTDPYVEFATPDVGTAGTETAVTLYGYNLPGSQPTDETLRDAPLEKLAVTVAIPSQTDLLDTDARISPVGAGMDAFTYRFEHDGATSNPVRIGISPDPVTLEQEPNNTVAEAQQVTSPVAICGRFGQREDSDIYRFSAVKGEHLMIEVFGERLGRNTDPVLRVSQVIRHDDGQEEIKQLSAVDDLRENLQQNTFETQSNDAVFPFDVPADGTYQVELRDRYWQSRGNPGLVYRLSIHPAAPDFRLVALPASLPTIGQTRAAALRKGEQIPITIYAYRRDGFEGAIRVFAESLPEGLKCTEMVLPAKTNVGTLVLAADETAQPGAKTVQLTGEAVAVADQQPVQKHPVRAATVVWNQRDQQAAICRVSDRLAISVLDEVAPYELTTGIARVEVNQSRQILIPLGSHRRGDFVDPLKYTVQNLPGEANFEIAEGNFEANQAEKTLRVFVKDNSAPGTYCFWLKGEANVPYRRNAARADRLQQEAQQAEQAALAAREVATAAKAKQQELEQSLVASNAQIAAMQQMETTQNTELASLQQKLEQQQSAVVQAQQKQTDLRQQTDELQQQLAAAQTAVTEAEQQLGPQDTRLANSQTERQLAENRVPQLEQALKTANGMLDKSPDDASVRQLTQQVEQSLIEARARFDASLQIEKQALEARNRTLTARDALLAKRQELEQRQGGLAEQQNLMAASLQAAEAALAETQQQIARTATILEENQRALAAQSKSVKQVQGELDASRQAVEVAEQTAKQAEAERDSLAQQSKQAQDAAAPKPVNYVAPSGPIVVVVKPAPVKLGAEVPDGGNLHKDGQLEVKVHLDRQNNFTGPATLSLFVPEGISGVTATEVSLPADSNDAVLMVQAGSDAPTGAIPNAVIRARMDHQGEAAVDFPITLTVQEP